MKFDYVLELSCSNIFFLFQRCIRFATCEVCRNTLILWGIFCKILYSTKYKGNLLIMSEDSIWDIPYKYVHKISEVFKPSILFQTFVQKIPGIFNLKTKNLSGYSYKLQECSIQISRVYKYKRKSFHKTAIQTYVQKIQRVFKPTTRRFHVYLNLFPVCYMRIQICRQKIPWRFHGYSKLRSKVSNDIQTYEQKNLRLFKTIIRIFDVYSNPLPENSTDIRPTDSTGLQT